MSTHRDLNDIEALIEEASINGTWKKHIDHRYPKGSHFHFEIDKEDGSLLVFEIGADEHRDPDAAPSSFWLSMLVPADKSRDIIANMEEVYREDWVPRYGVKHANRIWRSQCLQYIAFRWAWPIPLIWGAIKALKFGS